MFWRRKKMEVEEYDRDNWMPVLKCSICNGEQVAGFKNVHTGEFKEVLFVRDEGDLGWFKRRYGVEEVRKEY